MSSSRKNSRKALYYRLGGVFAIAAVVDLFSDRVIESPIVGVGSSNLFLRDWSRNQKDRLPGLKFMRTLWVCAVSGGPQKYAPTRRGHNLLALEKAHKRFHITSEEFDEVAGILSESMKDLGVRKKERDEVLSAFGAHKKEVVSA